MKHNELAQRITTVILLLIFTCLILAFSNHSGVLTGLTIFLCGFSVYEIYNAMNFQKDIPLIIISEVFSLIFCLFRIPHYTFFLTIIYPIVVLFFFAMMITHKKMELYSKIQAIMFLCVILFFFQSLKELRLVKNGFYYLAYAISISVFTDTFAFVWGKLLGKHKMAPTISPHKTWEGSIGGTVTCLLLVILAAKLVQRYTQITILYQPLVITTIAASILSQMGDLSMSVIKRVCGIKDYGSIFPGHGGVLDRFDSHLFALPFVLITQTYLVDFII